MKLTVTQATLNDIFDLNQLLTMLFDFEEEFTPDSQKQSIALETIIQNQQIGTIFVAKIDNKSVGMVSLLYTVSTALGGKVALLEDMIVASPYQNQGVGKALLSHALAFAQNQKIKRVTLLTDKTNTKAQRLYQAFGFEESIMLPMRIVF
ncbi:MAG: hypothetical protein KU38_07770 [Sulfurovum sp. FS08-3]|nr:MAG: hypothetical protein KU38_07770 [Sulfurovum sp. FS08-3]